MKTTISFKTLAKEELSIFKAQPNVYFPNLQISEDSIILLKEICDNFARNILNEAFKDPRITGRVLPNHINNVLNQRIDINFVNKVLPFPKKLVINHAGDYLC
jgi:hypothetical protein